MFDPTVVVEKPKGFEDVLGPYGPVDEEDGAPIAWGFRIKFRLDAARFEALRHAGGGGPKCVRGYGSFVCITQTEWAFVTHELTREEAIEMYGPVTDEPKGPKGGWRSITFGRGKNKKTFTSRQFYKKSGV